MNFPLLISGAEKIVMQLIGDQFHDSVNIVGTCRSDPEFPVVCYRLKSKDGMH